MSSHFLWIPLVYTVPTIVVYTATVLIICHYWGSLKNSFYQFYIFEYCINMFTLVNGLISYRLPSYTCSDCYLADFYRHLNEPKYIEINQFQFSMQFHMAYVQYGITTLVALSRISILTDHQMFEKKWKNYSWVLMVILFLFPFAFTYNVFLNKTYYKFDEKLDRFSLACEYSIVTMFSCLVPYMIGCSVITFLSNLGSLYKLYNYQKQVQSFESHFIYVTYATSTVHTIGAVISSSYIYTTHGTTFYEITNRSIPFVSDALCLIPPYLLLAFSAGVRNKLIVLFKSIWDVMKYVLFRKCTKVGTIAVP